MTWTNAASASDVILPPEPSQQTEPQDFAAGTTAALHDLWTGLGSNAPIGMVYVTVKAIGAGMRFYFRRIASGSALSSSTAGYRLEDGCTEHFWVNASVHIGIDVRSDSDSKKLQITVSSPQHNIPGKVLGT